MVVVYTLILTTFINFLFSEVTKATCEDWIAKCLSEQETEIKIYILDNIPEIPSKKFYPEVKKLSVSTNDNLKLKSLYVLYKVYKDTQAINMISSFLLQKPKLEKNASATAKAKFYIKNQRRAEAARILGEIGDKHVVDTLSKIVNDSTEDGNVKDAAYFALALLAQRGQVKPLSDIKEFFYSALKDLNPKVRLQAVKYIGELRYEDAVLPLSLRLKDVDKQVVLETISSLGKFGGNSVVVLQDLLQFKNHQDETYRLTLAESLGNIAKSICTSTRPVDTEAVVKIKNVLNNYLNDTNGMVRVASATSLMSIGDRTGVEVIKKGLDSNETDVVIYCIESLGKYGQKEDIKLIEKFLQHQDLKVKTATYCSILKIYFRNGTRE